MRTYLSNNSEGPVLADSSRMAFHIECQLRAENSPLSSN